MLIRHGKRGEDLIWTPKLWRWLFGKLVKVSRMNAYVVEDDGVTKNTEFADKFSCDDMTKSGIPLYSANEDVGYYRIRSVEESV